MPKNARKLKIVVTGGAGFIGSHIVDAYLAEGHRVSVIDSLSTGNPAYINPKAAFYKIDIRDGAALAAVMSKERPDVVNHQAAIASVTHTGDQNLEIYEVNTLGTINVLRAAAPFVKKFIFASSGGALYGKPRSLPARESETPSPISDYGFSKQLAEQAVIFSAKRTGIDYMILRPANVYGPRQNAGNEGGVVAIFTKLAREGAVPVIYRKEATRDYVAVSDVVKANILALSRGHKDAVHIGTGIETTNEGLFELISSEFEWNVRPSHKPARSGEIYRSCLDPKKAYKVLGWKPTVTLKHGVGLLKEQARS